MRKFTKAMAHLRYILRAQAERKLRGGHAARHSTAELSLPCNSWGGFAFDRKKTLAVCSSLSLRRLPKPGGKQLKRAGKTRFVRSRISAIGERLKELRVQSILRAMKLDKGQKADQRSLEAKIRLQDEKPLSRIHTCLNLRLDRSFQFDFG